MKKTIFLLAAFLSMAIAAEPTITILENGLTVVTQEIHYAPVVASFITYRVGSRNEHSDIFGMSHFCEHMMFKGTADMPKSRFSQIVQRDGGRANAFTGSDVTCYYLVLPSSRLEDALSIESDRMINCILDSVEIASERSVVQEERRARCVDNPNGALMEALSELAYTQHPYGHTVVGYDENIQAYEHTKVRNYYETYYCPSNAVLTIIGDFQTKTLLTQIDNYFGDIPSGFMPEENIPIEPEQTEARYIEIEHASDLSRFVMSFHTVNGTHPDNPALTMISSYLSSGKSAKLHQLLVETDLVHQTGTNHSSGIDPGMFGIYVAMNPSKNCNLSIEEITEIIWNELDNLAENGISEEILQEFKDRYRAGEILGNANPLGLAMNYGIATASFGNPFYSRNQLELMEQLTPDDISEVASRYFQRNGLNLAVLVPSAESETSATRARAASPSEARIPSSINYTGLEIPEGFLQPPTTSIADGVLEYELENGLVLLVKEDHTFPVIAINFSVPMGSLMHSPELTGLSSITSRTMLRGTEGLSYADFHKRLEVKGSSLRFNSSLETSSGAITMLSKNATIAFSAVSDLLLRPAFRESDFALVKGDSYTSITASAKQAFTVASNNLAMITAETSSQSRIPSFACLDLITIDEVQQYYNSCCRPEGTVITVVGDIDPDVAYAMTRNSFADWSNPDMPIPEIQIPEFSTAPGDTTVEFIPGRVQSVVLISTKAPGRKMPDYPAFSVMNTILGRGMGSRLNHSVRDEQGLAYSLGIRSSALDSTGVFTTHLTTLADNVPQATASVFNEINRISTENVLDIELLLAKANSVGKQALAATTYPELASRLTSLQASGKPLDWHLSYLGKILDLTADDLREVAADYFSTEKWFISIAGGSPKDILTE